MHEINMNTIIRTPVKRENAEKYVLISLVSFAATVILTRGFLALTGYPQLGGGNLHIAHVLWGGLFLFIASLLPLILANRWALNYSAIASGIGVGLFIDEVGKFITQNNNYFYPPAAPIIYAFFLLTLLVYFQVRKPPSRNPRAEMYRILEGLTEILDGDLEQDELKTLQNRMQSIARNISSPNSARLANALFEYLHTHEFQLTSNSPNWSEKLIFRSKSIYDRFATRKLLKMTITAGFIVVGVRNLLRVITIFSFWLDPQVGLSDYLAPLVEQSYIRSLTDAYMYFARIGLDSVIALVLLVASGMVIFNKERKGVNLGAAALLVSLVVLNLLVFYIDQFQAVFRTLGYLILLIITINYRRKYLANR